MKRWMAIVLAVCVAVAMASLVGVSAVSHGATKPVAKQRQLAVWHLKADSVSGSGWHFVDINGFPGGPSNGFKLFDSGLMTAAVSAEFEGAPVQLHFNRDLTVTRRRTTACHRQIAEVGARGQIQQGEFSVCSFAGD